ncbi:MAG: B12-binding domain-containing radical SAM protein [Geopsychrobacter sp.]|nr:B12-binding domain-containing radical SAM protein [Geopsychrobacter sp.]
MRTLLTTLHSKYIHPSLALPCLAAYCGDDCGELLIREYTVHQPKENLLAQIAACATDVVCFSVYIWNRQLTLELVNALKLAQPGLRIVLGGPEVSFEAADFFKEHTVDALICGEGEIPLRHLLSAWQHNRESSPCPGVQLPGQSFVQAGQSLLGSLDQMPSPFVADLVDLSRGYVYYESSRGCPYGCSFCMSSLDDKVRSFSLPRIKQDLGLLMDQQVAQIKFVDRTFNYHAARIREIIRFILEHNQGSHFHFEIGADLLDEETLQLLKTVPENMFQFEIGVQTTSLETLGRIGRTSSLKRLEENVRRLLNMGNIDLHLDLIAGLPGEDPADFYGSLRRVFALNPQHVQVELVKLLPGAPLRQQAESFGLKYDPAPPYTVLKTPDLDYPQLEEIRRVGRLIDLLGNAGRYCHFLQKSEVVFGDRVDFFRQLQHWWQGAGLFDEPLGLPQQFMALQKFVDTLEGSAGLREALARDYALLGRVVPGKAPAFFDCDLTMQERELVKHRVRCVLDALPSGDKLQHFATVFTSLKDRSSRCLALYLYRSRSGMRPVCEEIFLE